MCVPEILFSKLNIWNAFDDFFLLIIRIINFRITYPTFWIKQQHCLGLSAVNKLQLARTCTVPGDVLSVFISYKTMKAEDDFRFKVSNIFYI